MFFYALSYIISLYTYCGTHLLSHSLVSNTITFFCFKSSNSIYSTLWAIAQCLETYVFVIYFLCRTLRNSNRIFPSMHHREQFKPFRIEFFYKFRQELQIRHENRQSCYHNILYNNIYFKNQMEERIIHVLRKNRMIRREAQTMNCKMILLMQRDHRML